MPLSGKQLLKLYLEQGWLLDRVNGSHHILKKGDNTAVVPVHGNRDLAKGLERALLKQLNEQPNKQSDEQANEE